MYHTESLFQKKEHKRLLQAHKALNEIQSKNDVVNTTADEGIAMVILDVNQCTKEAEQSTSHNKPSILCQTMDIP